MAKRKEEKSYDYDDEFYYKKDSKKKSKARQSSTSERTAYRKSDWDKSEKD